MVSSSLSEEGSNHKAFDLFDIKKPNDMYACIGHDLLKYENEYGSNPIKVKNERSNFGVQQDVIAMN